MHLPSVIGHRGAAASAPENTLAGFRAAAALGVEWVEFDVRLSADGVPVVIHDATLERTTNGRGLVADQPAATLTGLDAGGWFAERFAGEPIPTLSEAMAELGRLGLGANVEIKAETDRAARATAAACAPILRENWWRQAGGLLLSSFSEAALEAAAEVMPEVPRGLLLDRMRGGSVERALALGCASINVGRRWLRAEAVAAAKAVGLPVLVYTVNEPAAAARLWSLGVDAIFSDDPARLPHLIDRDRKPRQN